MTATPAQVANDLEAQATFWRKRDDDIAKACLDAAHMIRLLLARRPVDGRSWTGLHRRLLNLMSFGPHDARSGANRSLQRGLDTLTAMRREAGL